QGSCTGWSSTYAARTISYAIQNNLTDRAKITSLAFSPSYAYNQAKLGADCSRGAYIFDALTILRDQGVARLSDFPYECNRKPSYSDKQKAANYKIQDYKRLNGYGDTYVSAIKKSISEKKPVVMSMKCFGSFSNAKELWNGVPDLDRGLHAMTIIGYDDYKFGGAFEIMNSWGANWGNGGFTWVRYDDFSRNSSEAYEMIDDFSKKDEDLGEPDLSGSLSLVKTDGTTMIAKLQNYAGKQQGVYRITTPQYSGTEFQIQFANNQPAFVYMIGSDLTGDVDVIFPFKNISAAFTYKSSNVAIPSEKHYIRMNEVIGRDYLCILYSKKPLNINDIKKRIQSTYGNFQDRVSSVLANDMVSKSDVKFNSSKVSFSAKSKGKSVVAMVVEIEHK
ncbi:MAG: hypothetical protein ACI85I_001029, partial [Arenicella sp.]